ncbi:MAG TPA: hypothetical protein VFU27_07725, partial [Terriglobales bacterium]|nr:hypothetical protein [Terriglobales bacterium]
MWHDSIYSHLPIALQELAVSLRGAQLHQLRYRSSWSREASQSLERQERLSPDALADLQFAELRRLAGHCYKRSRFYRRLWQAHGVQPQDIRSFDDVRHIPIVGKQELRAHTEEFFTEKIHGGMTAVHTSGTTGSPLTVYFSAPDVARRFAFLERCRRWAGVRIGQRRATFTGRHIIPHGQSAPPFWRHNIPGRQLLFSSYHLLPANLAAYLDALEDFQPEILDGYPSAIHVVADYMLRRGSARRIHPRAILVSAETVFPHQRQTIEQAFAAKLYNQYASSDGAPFISECRYGRLHVHTDSGVVEILDGEHNPVSPGRAGEMVVSSFTTSVVPLLRFAMGDIAVASQEHGPCLCGLPFPTVEALVGRVDDMLYTPDRGFVGRLDTVFKGVPNSIVEAQIVQTSPQSIVLRLVPDRCRYQPEHAARIVSQMRDRLGEMVEISVEEVASLPRSANGKMRPVVNACKDLLPAAFHYA